MQIKYQIQLWFHWGCSYIQTTVGSQQITSITVSKYTNIYLQVMVTRHNTRLHEVLWWQGGAGGRGVCQAGGRPPQAGPAWPGRIMLGRGRQDIQVMTRIRILLFLILAIICRVIPGTHSSFYSKEFRPVYRKIVQPE